MSNDWTISEFPSVLLIKASPSQPRSQGPLLCRPSLSFSRGREGEDPGNEVESKCETVVIVICSPSNKNQNLYS